MKEYLTYQDLNAFSWRGGVSIPLGAFETVAGSTIITPIVPIFLVELDVWFQAYKTTGEVLECNRLEITVDMVNVSSGGIESSLLSGGQIPRATGCDGQKIEMPLIRNISTAEDVTISAYMRLSQKYTSPPTGTIDIFYSLFYVLTQ